MLVNLLEAYPLRFIDMAEKDGYIWFSSCNFNGLFRGSLADGKVEYIGLFPEAKENAVLLHSIVAIYKDALFFGPKFSEYVVVYDIKSRKFENYEVPGLKGYDLAFGLFAAQHGQFLFIWNYNNADVIRFDMEMRIFEPVKLCGDASLYKYTINCEDVKGLWRSFCIVEDNIYISSIESGVILQINVKKNEKKIYLLDGIKKVNAICFGKGRFWFTDTENQLIEWYPNKVIAKHKIASNIPVSKVCFGFFEDDVIYYVLVGVEKDPILAFHINEKYFELIYQENIETRREGNEGFGAGSTMLKLMQNKIWLFSNMYSLLQYIEGQKIINCKLELKDNIVQFLQDRMAIPCTGYIYEEDTILDLEGYLKYILKISEDVNRSDLNNVHVENKYIR